MIPLRKKKRSPPLTADFKDLVRRWVRRDPAFRKMLFDEAQACIAKGEVSVGNAVLHDYPGEKKT